MATNTFFEKLRPASYKGVPFFVTEDSSVFGRNVVNHEFVQRSKNYVEDLGRKTRELKFSAWIVANEGNSFDPFVNRDALIEAVENGGYGSLIHPFFGDLNGVLHKVTVKQSTTQNGGLVSLELEFLEAGEKEIKAVAVFDSVGKVRSAAESSYSNTAEEFAATFNVENAQGFVLDDAFSMLKQFTDSLRTVRRAAGIAAQVAAGNLAVIGIFREPIRLANEIIAIIRDIDNTTSLIGYSRPEIRRTNTPSRQRQIANQSAFVNLIRNAAITRKTELSLEVKTQRNTADVDLGVPQLYTRKELDDYRRDIAITVTDQLINLSTLKIYPKTQASLAQLRTETVQHLTRVGETLGTSFFTLCEDNTNWAVYMPTIPVVYRHYGEIRSDEFNARNNVRNPLFNEPNAVMELLNV
jgi:prophage DNA circulation protein